MVGKRKESVSSIDENLSSYSDSELLYKTHRDAQKEYPIYFVDDGSLSTRPEIHSDTECVNMPIKGNVEKNCTFGGYSKKFSVFDFNLNRNIRFQGMGDKSELNGGVIENTMYRNFYGNNNRLLEQNRGDLLFVLSTEATAEADRLSKIEDSHKRYGSLLKKHHKNGDLQKGHDAKDKEKSRIKTRYDGLSEEQKRGLDYLVEVAESELRRLEREGGSLYRKIKIRDIETQSIREKRMMSDPVASSRSSRSNPIKNFSDIDDLLFGSIESDGNCMYICPEKDCGKMFPSLSRVKRHYIIHTGAKPFKCLNARCPKKFSRKDNMLQHYKTHCKFS